MPAPQALRVRASDNVAVLINAAPAGATLLIDGVQVTLRESVPAGHKVALETIAPDQAIMKYGAAIGVACAAIAPGDHVHSHNLRTALDGIEHYDYVQPDFPDRSRAVVDSFMGYRRRDGRVGTRNEIWIIPTVGCVAKIAERIAAEANKQWSGRIDGVHAFVHPFGCSQLGDDLASTRQILAALAAHPNAGGVLFIGLGCESNQIDKLLASAPLLERERVRVVKSQQVADEYEAGLNAVEELIELCETDERESCAASDLVIGVKCGGSDGFSGLTANPLVGRMTDRVVDAGGTSILTEIPEIFGAEKPLMARCENRQVFDDFVSVVNEFKEYFLAHDQKIYENPSPGNIEGGITTLEEKSLGAAQKAGLSAVVTDVLRYGACASKTGLTILEAPGNDAVSSTALTAAGATLILFTTGRGTPLGFPAPTIKISSNSRLAKQKARWIDFNAGTILDGEPIVNTETTLWELILDVASGAQTRNEQNDERSIAIWKRGVTL